MASPSLAETAAHSPSSQSAVRNVLDIAADSRPTARTVLTTGGHRAFMWMSAERLSSRPAMSDNRKITISSSRMAEHNAMRVMGRGSPALRPETIAVRAGAEIDPDTGPLSPPLHLSTTFEHGPASEAIHGFRYAREKNQPQLRP